MIEVQHDDSKVHDPLQSLSEYIWRSKYQASSSVGAADRTINDTWSRVATSLSLHEPRSSRLAFRSDLIEAFSNYELLPAGRILAGCGTRKKVSLSNTFVMSKIPDSIEGIMDVAKDAALTMKMGGGIGLDFSSIRPKGSLVAGLCCPSGGPLMAMEIFDAVCRLLVSGSGRGAMMATMRCDHPDIIEFIKAKDDPQRFKNFNQSVTVTDALMAAIHEDSQWELVWAGEVSAIVKARDLWDLIMRQNYTNAEPGVLFIDRINALNPLNYLESIETTNSCAEQPLPSNGTCPLASINLSRLVVNPFGNSAKMDIAKLKRLTRLAVRMLDAVIDESDFPTELQRSEAMLKRRIGVGVTGVADALVMMNIRYGTKEAADLLGKWMEIIQNASYYSSALLAKERGSFPLYQARAHRDQFAITSLDPRVQDTIAKYGLRNGTLTTIAPTGTTSMLAENVSSGIEPIFALSYSRKVQDRGGEEVSFQIFDYAVLLYIRMFGSDVSDTGAFVTVEDLTPDDHIRMQASAQRWVDSGISKTVNCKSRISFEDFQRIYEISYSSGCKGCTTYRPNSRIGSVLSS